MKYDQNAANLGPQAKLCLSPPPWPTVLYGLKLRLVFIILNGEKKSIKGCYFVTRENDRKFKSLGPQIKLYRNSPVRVHFCVVYGHFCAIITETHKG